MLVELFSIGTELLLGDIVDTNAAYLAEKLSQLGVHVYHKTTVGDNAERLAAALQIGLERADVVLATGGLGPTEDDLTAAVVAEAMGVGLCTDEATAEKIRLFARQRGIPLLEGLLKQARIPRGAEVVPNPIGTAPGFILSRRDKTVIALPGVPTEMKAMAEQTVLPYLAQHAHVKGDSTIVSRTLRLVGIGESQAEAEIKDLIEAQTNPTIAPYARTAEVHLRVTARATTREEALALIAPVEEEIRKRLGEHVYGVDDESLEARVGQMLREAGETLAVAESCTGGLIGHRLTNISGSSDYLLAGLVTYSNESKVGLLKVREETIAIHGAVSREIAQAMAEGVREVCGADYGLSITGIAGPTGGTKAKPVGLTYVGLSDETQATVEEHRLRGDRVMIKERGAQIALYLLYRRLRERLGART